MNSLSFMTTPKKRFVCFVLTGFMAQCALGSIANGDDSAAPSISMRDFSSDRPDKTDGPRTIDAGHLQLEMDFATYTFSKQTTDGDTTRATQYAIAPVNLRLGILKNSEVDFIVSTYNIQENHDITADTKQRMEGYGDTDFRYKLNLFGNDTDGLAMGLISRVKIPTSQDDLGNHSVEGGQSLVADYPLFGFDIGAETDIDVARNAADDGDHAEFINSITVHHDLIKDRLNAYVEFYSDVPSNDDFTWIGTVDAGLLWTVTKNIQLDCSANFGVTNDAPRVNVGSGLSVRF